MLYEEIRIEGIDDALTEPSPKSADMRRMFVQLNMEPMPIWISIFDNQRRLPRHSRWRDAHVEGSHIVVDCVPEEMQKYHLPDLKGDVEIANTEYRKYFASFLGRAKS